MKKIKFIYRILPSSFIYFLFSHVITLIMFTLNSLQLTKEIWRKFRCVWGLADVCVCVILISFIFSPVIILITHTVNYFNNFRNDLDSLQLTEEICRKFSCVCVRGVKCLHEILTTFIFSPFIITLIMFSVNFFNNLGKMIWISYNWLIITLSKRADSSYFWLHWE